MFVKIFICITLLAIGIKGFTTKDVEGPIVSTELGQVQGTIDQSFFDKEYFSFRAIPYAEPPIEEYRFRVSYYY